MGISLPSSLVEVSRKLHSVATCLGMYTTGEGLKFVDRVREAIAFLYPATYPLEASRGLSIGRVSVVMGPRGCGKTELVKALRFAIEVSKIREIEVLLLEYRDREGITETFIHIVSRDTKKLVLGALKKLVPEVVSKVIEVATGFRIPSSIDGLSLLLALSEKARGDTMYVVVVDELRGSIESVRQILEVDANEVRDLLKQGIKAKLIYLTSDAIAIDLVQLIGTKVDWYLIWNLPREAFEELARQWLSYAVSGIDTDMLWRVIGGNPREFIDLAKDWSLERYTNDKLSAVVEVLKRYSVDMNLDRERLFVEVKEIVEDIDSAGWHRLWRYLLKNDMGIDIDTRFTYLTELPRGEPWIGKHHSFQLPIYYWVLKTIAIKKSLDVTPRDVLSVVDRG